METLPRTKEAVLLVNTRSLMGAEWLEQARAKLYERDLKLVVAQGFNRADELFARARKEAHDGRLIIVGGGDGTMSAIADILIGTDCVMGVLPLGTGNAFARDLAIPTDLDRAVEIISEGKVEEVDVGVAGGRHFVNVATIGLTTTIAKSLTVPMKRRFGRFVYAIALTKALRDLSPFQARIETENGVTEVETVQIVIGNGRYHAGPLPLSPTAAITSGHFRLYAVEFTSKAALLKYALLLPTGLQGVLKEVHSEATIGGRIITNPGQSVVVDGEIGAKTPLEFSVEPLALKVMVGTDFKG